MNNPQKKLFEKLEEQGIPVPNELKEKIQRQIDGIYSYEPRIGIFGKTGAGKSSLCNALFGSAECKISDVGACTRNPQEVLLAVTDKGLRLVDVPGVGESSDRDKEYAELYHKLLPELDLVLWVLKADDRAFSSDETFYKQVVRPHMEQGKPFIIALNQIDKIEPFREWDVTNSRPGLNQAVNIEEKRRNVSVFFDLPMEKVIPVSANEKYGLINLIDSIIFSLPNEKKISFSKFVPLENLSEKAIEEAEKGLLESIADLASRIIPGAREVINLAKAAWKTIKGWFS